MLKIEVRKRLKEVLYDLRDIIVRLQELKDVTDGKRRERIYAILQYLNWAEESLDEMTS